MDAAARPAWERLGRLLATRRAQLDPRYRIRKVFAEESGLNYGLVRDIELAVRDSYKATTIAAVERAYAWGPGSIERVLAGGDPTPLDTALLPTAALPAIAFAAEGATADTNTTSTLTLGAGPARRPPRWFASEVERRGADITTIVANVAVLREIAGHFGYTLGDLLIQAGLATTEDLFLAEPEARRERNFLAEFDAHAERILADPQLTRGQRKDVERTYRQLRKDIEKLTGPPKD